jgi:GntR family transcriptional regulator, rspAB operon transcriptional repressor
MFHATIAEVAGYPGIWTLIQQVKVHVDRYRRLTLPQQGRIPRVIVEHEAILDAIEMHDPAGARSAMEFHLERLLDNISATQSINPEFFDRQSRELTK